MPTAVERRRAGRVTCRLPVRLVCGGHVSYATTEDLSLTGVRLRVALSALDLPSGTELGAVTRRINQRLGEAFVAEFAWDTLGSLVRRVLRVVRVAAVIGDPATVDLGCELRVPLELQETQALGLTLPSQLAAAAAAGQADDGGSAFLARAVLIPPRELGRAPVRAQMREIHPDELVLTLARPDRLSIPQENVGVMDLIASFDERFGHSPYVLVLGADQPLWAGSARVSSVEWQRAEELLHVSLRLDEPLRSDELSRLGIT